MQSDSPKQRMILSLLAGISPKTQEPFHGSLDLSHMGIDDTMLVAILPYIPSLDIHNGVLDLSGNPIGPAGMDMLKGNLERIHPSWCNLHDTQVGEDDGIDYVDIKFTMFGERAASAVSDLIRDIRNHHAVLGVVDLSHNLLYDHGVGEILHQLGATKMTSLSLDGTGITTGCFHDLKDLIEKCPALENLNLSNNPDLTLPFIRSIVELSVDHPVLRSIVAAGVCTNEVIAAFRQQALGRKRAAPSSD